MPCVICAEGECSPCCFYLNHFPAEAPFTEESKSQADKILKSKNMRHVKKNLLIAKIKGGLDAEKDLVESWIIEYDARQNSPIYGLAGVVTDTENRIKMLEEKINMYKNRYGPLEDDDDDDVAAAAGGGRRFSRLRKCTTSLD